MPTSPQGGAPVTPIGLDGKVIGAGVDGATQPSASNPVPVSAGPYPANAIPTIAGSGVVAAAAAVATLNSDPGKTTYIAGLLIAGGGATAAALVDVTIAGLLGGTQTFAHGAVAGATLKNPDVHLCFSPPLPASAADTDIVITCPSLGAGNAKNSVTAWGYKL